MDPVFAPFNPDGDALLRRMSRHIDDPILQHIAELDPVGHYAEGYFRELRKIRDQGVPERPQDSGFREVLRFSSSSEPDAVDRAKGAWGLRGEQGHWARAFSCAVLMRTYGDPETRQIIHSGYSADLIQLLESLRHIDAGLEPEAMAALAWFILRLHTSNEAGVEEEIEFAGLGLLSLAIRSRDAVPDAAVLRFTDWLLAQERQTVEAWGEGFGDFNSLLKTNHFMFPDKWKVLGAELAAVDAISPRGAAVRDIGKRLTA